MSARATAMAALEARISGAYAWASPVSRVVKLWDEVPKYTRPAPFLFGGGGNTYEWVEQRHIPKRIKTVDLVIYIDSSSSPGDPQIDDILDALDAALTPTGQELMTGRCTLGGTVYHCRLDGPVHTVPGDLDGDGMIWAKIKLVLP